MDAIQLGSNSEVAPRRAREALNMVLVGKARGDLRAQDFEVEPRASVLLMRDDVVDAAYDLGARTLIDFLAILEDTFELHAHGERYPLQVILPDWSIEELREAYNSMKTALRGVVADNVLDFGTANLRVAWELRLNDSSGGKLKIE